MSAFTLASRDLSMQFPAVLALDSVSVSFRSGEVHGVVGENGAGKSTLMRILSGIQTPTSGEVFISGQPVRLHGVRDAIGRGIAMIHQELDVVDELTVAENIFLGEEITKRGILCSTKMKEETRALLSQLGAKFSADTRVESLSVAGKQLVAVAKALSLNAKVLIMDEPTAVLSEHEADALFSVIEKLKSQGVAIVYISHRLSEVLQICDRITVLRDGRVVRTLERGEADESELASLMVGRPLQDVFPPKSHVHGDAPVLEVRDVCLRDKVEWASFEILPGEIVGIAGLVGSGRTELCESLVGLRPLVGGEVYIQGECCKLRGPKDAMKRGVCYLSEDRKGLGLVLDMNTVENVTLPTLRKFASLFIDKKREKAVVSNWIETLDIRVGDVQAPTLYLSGGNQQKVCLAKWLEVEPRVLILDEPTRGVDVGAKRELYELIARLAREGMACIVVSSELPEIIGLCHRALVMRNGRIVGEVPGPLLTEEAIMRLAAGVDAA